MAASSRGQGVALVVMRSRHLAGHLEALMPPSGVRGPSRSKMTMGRSWSRESLARRVRRGGRPPHAEVVDKGLVARHVDALAALHVAEAARLLGKERGGHRQFLALG